MKKKLLYLFIVIWSLFPVLWSVRTSIIANELLYKKPIPYLDVHYQLDQYKLLFQNRQFIKSYGNSLIESLIPTIVILVIAILAGYAFARFDFKGQRFIQLLILATLATPPYAIIIPLYRYMAKLNLIGSYFSIMSIYTAAFLPLAVWMMSSAFKALPFELEEAAQIDGANRIQSIWITLPVMMPSIIATVIITFLSCYSQFVFPMLFTSTDTQPVTVIMTQFVSKTSADYSLISAAGVLTLIPPIGIAFLLSKYLISGLTDGIGR